MRPDQLTETLGSALGNPTRNASPPEHPDSAAPLVVFTVSGPGFSDSEQFAVTDVRAARAAARKLMASAIRLFGKAEGTESE